MSDFAHRFHLSPDQAEVISALSDWLKNPNGQSITVGGYAGTGKTTLISVLRALIKEQHPKFHVAFACYTGKASQVLKQKLVAQKAILKDDFCGTIHSLMYTAVTDDDGKILRWKRNPDLPYDLIVIDEASMVTSDIWKDLSAYNLPMIAVGDHGQLPPIESAFNLMDDPQLRLETIHRQAEGNPIIELATMARQNGEIPFKKFSDSVRKVDRRNEDSMELFEQWLTSYPKESLVLCARNKTRTALNKHIRKVRGYESEIPQVGETLICLKNNYESAGGPIYNGMLGTLTRLEEKYIHWFDVDVQFHDEHRLFTGEISQHQFGQEKVIQSVKGLHYSRIGDLFDFGYALTVHKAQGSQAKTVVVFEEYAPYMSDEEWRRWLYTAVTRASERLLILR
jgi:exodeoxyribonuclease V